MLQRLAPPSSQNPSEAKREELYERGFGGSTKGACRSEKWRANFFSDEADFERLAAARERVMQMVDPIVREYELNVLADDERKFVLNRGARRAQQTSDVVSCTHYY